MEHNPNITEAHIAGTGEKPVVSAEQMQALRGLPLTVKVSASVRAHRLQLAEKGDRRTVSIRLLYVGAAVKNRTEGLHPGRDPHTYSRLASPFPEEPDPRISWGLYRDAKGDLWMDYFMQVWLKDPEIYRTGLGLVFEVPEILAEKEPVLTVGIGSEILYSETLSGSGVQTREIDVRHAEGALLSYMAETRRLQFRILDELERICREHQITWYLICGGLIGVVRDGDLIPWDDDLDIAMTRENYEKFAAAAREAWKDDDSFLWLPCEAYGSDTFLDFMTRIVYLKEASPGDAFDRLHTGRKDIHNRQVADIYVLEEAGNSRLLHTLRARYLQMLYAMALGHRDGFSADAHTEYGKGWRRLAELLRRIGGRIPLGRLLTAYGRAVSPGRSASGGKYYYLSNGYYRCFPMRFRREWFGEGRVLLAGQRPVQAPKEAERYLKAMYGDYLEYPPVWERHPMHAGSKNV